MEFSQYFFNFLFRCIRKLRRHHRVKEIDFSDSVPYRQLVVSTDTRGRRTNETLYDPGARVIAY